MGNRAVIALDKFDAENGQGVYLHWNGGRDSIESFLEFVRIDHTAFIQETGVDKLLLALNAFGFSDNKVTVEPLGRLDCDNYDNGVYVVDTQRWVITDRVFKRYDEQKHHNQEAFVRGLYVSVLEYKVKKLQELVNLQDQLVEVA